MNDLTNTNDNIGYSEKISDPRFAKYMKSNNKILLIADLIVSTSFIVTFFFYGMIDSNLRNPISLYIGIALALFSQVFFIFRYLKKKFGNTWEGRIVDKRIKEKKDLHIGTDTPPSTYYEYRIYIESDRGKEYKLISKDEDKYYNYFKIGDRVKYHGGLESYEKYDKSNDGIILCNACGAINSLTYDDCDKCGCPLLK